MEDLSNILSLDVKYYGGGALLSVDISVEDVRRQLCKLNPSKSSGPDGCHPRVFVELKVVFLDCCIYYLKLTGGRSPHGRKLT